MNINRVTQGESQINRSVTPLAGGVTYAGDWEQNGTADALVVAYADVAGTFYVDLSVDGGASYTTIPSAGFTVTAGRSTAHHIIKADRHFRVRYVNGAAAQAEFRLFVYYGGYGPLNLPLNSVIGQDSDAITVRSITEEVSIAEGKYDGYSVVNKFGTNADIDTGSVPEDIWEVGGAYTGFASAAEPLSVVSASVNDAAAGTGARTVRIIGLDVNYAPLQETVTLNGTTPVTTSASFLRAHTASVQSAGSGGVNAGDITIGQSVTTANVMLSLLAGRNQSNCSAYTVPAGFTAYMRHLHVALRGTTGAANSVEGAIWTRAFGAPFRSRRPFSANTSFQLSDVIYGGLVFTEKSDLVLRITAVGANNTSLNGGYDLLLVRD